MLSSATNHIAVAVPLTSSVLHFGPHRMLTLTDSTFWQFTCLACHLLVAVITNIGMFPFGAPMCNPRPIITALTTPLQLFAVPKPLYSTYILTAPTSRSPSHSTIEHRRISRKHGIYVCILTHPKMRFHGD